MNYLIASFSNDTILRTNESDTIRQYHEYKITRCIWIIIPPILLFLGSIGNCLTIIVYTKSSLKTTAMAVYLTALAVSDIIALYTGFFTEWLTIAFDSNIKNYKSIGCKIHSWFLFTSVQFSAWVITIITVERVICVWFPFRARRVESKRCAKIVVACLCVMLMILNSHALYGMVHIFDMEPIFPSCAALSEDYHYFFQNIWPFIDSTVYCFVPCSLIIIGNSLILYKLKQKIPHFPTSELEHCDFRRNLKVARERKSLFPLIFCLNTVFVLTTAPISIYQVALNFTHVFDIEIHSVKYNHRFLCWTILLMVMFLNHSINCLLYCFTGAKFRREIVLIFCNKYITSLRRHR
ncbi:probable G-protein coupled receptor 139 [Ruditapes philippinarum]|uniref:probable G-protein coupled receptor 139 n=1 Tax=Ruditapes philippinarum TaxID=129788 RepID=UPI00295A733E|nr:probable G-protein coupled receptor 139 [Ruditapes philippinarum]